MQIKVNTTMEKETKEKFCQKVGSQNVEEKFESFLKWSYAMKQTGLLVFEMLRECQSLVDVCMSQYRTFVQCALAKGLF